MATKILRKLSALALEPKLKTIARGFGPDDDGALVFLGRIIGVIRKAALLTTQYGESWKFSGEFRGTNSDGQECVASTLFLPDVVADPLAGAVGEEGKDVEFAFDLFIRADSGSTTGYVYEVESLQEVTSSDPVAALAARIASDIPLPQTAPVLAGPASEPEMETPTEVEEAGATTVKKGGRKAS